MTEPKAIEAIYRDLQEQRLVKHSLLIDRDHRVIGVLGRLGGIFLKWKRYKPHCWMGVSGEERGADKEAFAAFARAAAELSRGRKPERPWDLAFAPTHQPRRFLRHPGSNFAFRESILRI